MRQSQNAGPAAARNVGISAAKGKWIAFLDADDLWVRDKLERQVASLITYPDMGLWCGQTVTFESAERGKAVAAIQNASARKGDIININRIGLEELSLHRPVNPIATSTVLVNADLIKDSGGFDEQFCGPEDIDLWMRLVAKAPAAFLEVDLAWYEQRQGSLSMDDRTFMPQVLRVLEKAFAPTGVFHDRQELRRKALANQYWHASWMAFQRGSRTRALRHLIRAVFLNPTVGGRKQLPLWWRYVAGRP
jgi:glycosyltransferase involved in cell wall biosynthesis